MNFCVDSVELGKLEAVASGSKGGTRLPALVSLAWHLRHRDGPRALELIEQAQRLLAGAQTVYETNTALIARMALTRTEIDAFLSRVESAEQWLVEARALLPCAEDPILPGDAHLAESLIARATSDYERESRACAAAMECFQVAGDKRRARLADAMLTLLRAASPSDGAPPPEGEDDDPHWSDTDAEVDAYLKAAHALRLFQREPMRSVGLFLQAGEQASDMGLIRLAVISYVNAGTTLINQSDFEEAAERFEQAEQIAKCSGSPVLIATCRARIGALLRDLGHLSASREVLESALDSFGLAPPCVNAANAYRELALTLMAMGLKREAVEAIGRAIGIHRNGRHHDNLALYLIAQARILAAAQAPDEAMAAVAEAEALIRKHGLEVLSLNVDEALAEIHALHQLPAPDNMTQPTAVIYHAERVLQQGSKIDGWRAPTSLYSLLAEAWSEAGGLAQAYDYARKALKAKEQELALMPGDPQALLRLLLRSNGEDRPAPSSMKESPANNPLIAKLLTPKERDVVRLLAKNQSNKEIALLLGISGETVKSHLRSIYAKLNAGSRKRAVELARSAGMRE
ncbi:MAG: response regulator transcription factor [Paucibacter sp.]|nr:response regulator transcription factor [Roseateles sp.]